MRVTARGIAVMLSAACVAACTESTSGDSGKLTLQMTDAPFPFSQVSRVDMYVVRIDGRAAAADSLTIANVNSMSGWTTLVTPNASVNLLDLRGGVVTNLGTTTLATGTYNGFRLILDTDRSSVTLTDGSHPNIVWPSAAQTGVKINLDHAVSVTKDSSVMVLDFDVGRSFVLRGNSISRNGLLFKPVIRAVATELTGSVSGTVRASSVTGTLVSGATVEVLRSGTALSDTASANVVRTTVTDANGSFTIAYLLPGTYVLRATPPSGLSLTAALLAGGLTITSNAQVTGQVIVLTP